MDLPAYRQQPLRVACVQYDPKLGRVEENIRTVEALLKDLQPGSVDLVVLPEMAFSGYVFSDPSSIAPYLEPPRIGPSSLFCRSTAQRLGCYVACGYPERPEEEGERGWNSALIVSPSGEVVHQYRKTFLYETDKNWAREGDGFSYVDLPLPLGRVCLGICMDINPKDFIAPWDAYELSTFTAKNQVDILVLCNNWLSAPPSDPSSDVPAPPEESPDDQEHPEGPSLDTLNYWAHRLMPLHDPPPLLPEIREGEEGGARSGRETVVVVCNRVGTEAGSTFVGTSTVLRLTPSVDGSAEKGGGGSSSIEVLDCLGKKEEMVLFATVP